MKKTNILLYSILSVLILFTSCSDDSDPLYQTGTYVSSASFIDPDSGKEYILAEGTGSNTFEVYEWQSSDYGTSVGMKYAIELDLYENEFESPIVLTTTSSTQARFSVDEINNAINQLGKTEIEPVRLKMRIVTNAYGGEEGISPLTEYPTIYSNHIELIVTPYKQAEPEYPDNLYMIGAEFGNWDWNSDGIIEMIPVWGKPGSFWCINYFSAGQGFKWAPNKAWGADFPELRQVTGYSVSDGNAILAADGLYVVYIDMAKGIIAIEEAKVYGMGDCFGDWTEGSYPFTIKDKVMTYTTTGAGELRMYAGSTYATSDWWTREFIIIGGKIVYRGTGDDQERINVAAGKIVTLDFRAGTGSIQ